MDEPVQSIAEHWKDSEFFLYLGRHVGLPVALEGPVADLALAAGPEGFVLVFQQDDGSAQRRLFATNVRLK